MEATTNKPRRVGTFTLGVVLVICGALMALSLFLPDRDFSWALKGSPLILISLGSETLLACRKSDAIRYDWMGMLLCFLLVCCALCLYAVAWWFLHGPDYGFCL